MGDEIARKDGRYWLSAGGGAGSLQLRMTPKSAPVIARKTTVATPKRRTCFRAP